MSTLEIKDLHVSVNGKEILKGIDLAVNQGEIHAIMGPNGSGKSTLSLAIMGHPRYNIDKGEILFNGKDISKLKADERSRLGLFLAFQNPQEADGVSVSNFIRTAMKSCKNNGQTVQEFQKLLKEKMALLNIDPSFARRYVNYGFSGGEKKKGEILQLSMLNPKIAVLDEADSGLDIDALKTVGMAIGTIAREQGTGMLLITHYKRLLEYVQPQFVHLLIDGKIVNSGGSELADHLEEKGYAWSAGEEDD